MAKRKILIEFTANPILGNAFSYDIAIGGIPFLYPNGLTTLNLDYVSGSNVPYISIGKKVTLSETIDATINFLIEYYSSPFITYTRVDNNIEILLNFENAVVTYPEEANDNILISDDAYSPNVNLKLKYLVEWSDAENVLYSVRIYQKGFTGTATEVSGYGVLKYGSVKDNLEAIRGNGLDLSLNATTELTLEDLYTEEENSFSVKMYRKNVLLFDGFLKPDGVYQSFVQDEWVLSLSCVDGLGLLKDLAFVQSNGFHWAGKQRAIDVVYNCLNRTGLQMNINTSVNIYYDGLVPSDNLDPLHEIYVSVERFIKNDNDTIMDCNEVLSSVLNLFNAVICQISGQWYIYRPTELFENPIVKFRQYSETDNSYIKLNTKNLEFNLGSQINNFYPHHCGGNQQIEIKGSVSAARINYKYGFEKSVGFNPYLNHTEYDYENWNVLEQELIILDPTKNQGLITLPLSGGVSPPPTSLPILSSNGVNLISGDLIDLTIKANYTPGNILDSRFRVVLTNELNVKSYLKKDGSWSSIETIETFLDFRFTGNLNVTLKSQGLPFSGEVVIFIYEAIKPFQSFGYYEVTYCDLTNSQTVSSSGAIGEFHTVQRQNRPSSISTETSKIYNGDSPSVIYDGAVYKNDFITPTSNWFRREKTESKPVLQIAVEDVLRLQQKPQKLFTGDIYGFMPYLSVVNIDNLEGKFLPIEWSFDALKNTTSVKLLQFFGDELNDIDYKYTLDYGNTTKVTITS